MRKQFDSELELLHTELIEMGAMCESAIDSAQKALLENDASAASDISGDIERSEKEIESHCLKLMLRNSPVASDLRKISVALKIITDMERIGVQAGDIAEIVRTGSIAPEVAKEIKLGAMAEAVKHMVTNSINSFVKNDARIACDIITYDDVVDRLFDETRESLIAKIGENGITGASMLDLLMIAKYYERIGDHAANIAEWVLFGITGHHGENKG